MHLFINRFAHSIAATCRCTVCMLFLQHHEWAQGGRSRAQKGRPCRCRWGWCGGTYPLTWEILLIILMKLRSLLYDSIHNFVCLICSRLISRSDQYLADQCPTMQDNLQRSTDQVVKRKIKIAFKTCDPEALSDGLQGIYAGLMAVTTTNSNLA